MIHAVTAANAALYEDQLDQMHRMRHDMYVVQRGWTGLQARAGREFDEFDTQEAVYLMNLSDTGELRATFRLMPTSSPYLLQKLSGFVLGEPPASPKIWDMTRWMIAPSERKQKGEARSRAQAELGCGLFEFACTRGLTHYTTLADVAFFPALEVAGWVYEPLGLPTPFEGGKGTAIAIKIETGAQALRHIRTVCGIHHPVLFEAPAHAEGWTTAGVLATAAALRKMYGTQGEDDRLALAREWSSVPTGSRSEAVNAV